MVGAIILVAPEIPQLPRGVSAAKASGGDSRQEEFKKKTPLACVEVLGRSVLERGVDLMLRAGVSAITLLGDSCFAPVRAEVDQAATNFPLTWGDAWLGATRILRRHKEPGIDVTFLVRAAAYVELDPLDALRFHRGQRQLVTRAFDEEGALDIWIIDYRQRQGYLVACPKRPGINVAEFVALQASLDCDPFFRSPSVYVGSLRGAPEITDAL